MFQGYVDGLPESDGKDDKAGYWKNTKTGEEFTALWKQGRVERAKTSEKDPNVLALVEKYEGKLVADLKALQNAGRAPTAAEAGLIKLFNSPPKASPQQVQDYWEQFKSFQFWKYVFDNKLVTSDAAMTATAGVKTASGDLYQGQVTLSQPGPGKSYGRFQGPWGTYEGQVSDSAPEGYGRYINTQGSTYLGTWTKGYPFGAGTLTNSLQKVTDVKDVDCSSDKASQGVACVKVIN